MMLRTYHTAATLDIVLYQKIVKTIAGQSYQLIPT